MTSQALPGTSAPAPAGARPVPFYLPFRGSVIRVSPGVLLLRGSAPGSVLRTTLDDGAPDGAVEVVGAGEAHLEARITLLGDGSLHETGTIGFGGGTAVRFRSAGAGRLAVADADPGLEHGAVSCVIDAGSGRLAGVTGVLVSTFLVSRTGELTDHQLGLVFLPVVPDGGHAPSLIDIRPESALLGGPTATGSRAGEAHGGPRLPAHDRDRTR